MGSLKLQAHTFSHKCLFFFALPHKQSQLRSRAFEVIHVHVCKRISHLARESGRKSSHMYVHVYTNVSLKSAQVY